MKTTLLILSCALVLASACSKKCEPTPANNYCGGGGDQLVQVHAGDRDCDATLVAGDIVIASSQCVRSAKLADVSVEVEGEVLSAVEIHGDADSLAIRVGHAFGAAGQE
jgi:hypothetical protein